MPDEMNPGGTETNRAEVGARFDTVVVPELDVLFRVARSISINVDDAEDLVQDTLLRAFRALDRFDGRYPRAWLLTIMRNAHHNRNRRRRPTLLRDEATMNSEIDRRNPPAPSAEDLATGSITAAWVADALDHLTPRLQQVAQLVDVDGLTYDETAALLDLPTGTVMSRLHRARRQMRVRLERHPDFRSEN
jgi:RNA polymerase sigma-70 factor (ECF subfamily)